VCSRVLSPLQQKRLFADVVVDDPGIDLGFLEPFKVLQTRRKTPMNHHFRNIVTPCRTRVATRAMAIPATGRLRKNRLT